VCFGGNATLVTIIIGDLMIYERYDTIQFFRFVWKDYVPEWVDVHYHRDISSSSSIIYSIQQQLYQQTEKQQQQQHKDRIEWRKVQNQNLHGGSFTSFKYMDFCFG
jgi:hypothetical protein